MKKNKKCYYLYNKINNVKILSSVGGFLKVNDIIELDIIDNGMNFEGIARCDDKVVFVPDTIKGEKVVARVIKDTPKYTLAKAQEILIKSKDRTYEDCMSYYSCGGCVGKHMTYDRTLDIKREIVKNALRKQGIDDNLVGDIYGMGVPYNYRNKVQFPVRNIKGRNAFGMFSEKSHKLVEVAGCNIQDKCINEVARYMFDMINKEKLSCYDEINKKGDIKNIMVRRGTHTGEILCIIVVTNKEVALSEKMKNVCDCVVEKYSDVKGFVVNINETSGNVILGKENVVLFGEDRITDKIGDKSFYISTNSFFQVNTVMAEVIYSVLEEMLELKKEEDVLELYSGVGSIGIFLSDKVKSIYGIEIVKDAVDMARKNVKLNNVKNATYICDDAKIALEKLEKENKKFDKVIVDPPRKGLDEAGIEILLKLKPKKIGYISCNPATLARDLARLEESYVIEKIVLADMFCWTSHVECVTVLKRKH